MVANRVPVGTGLLRQFGDGIRSSTIIERLQNGLIGKDAAVEGPFGSKPLLYADYVASGRSLLQVEQFVMDHVLPYYANSHTEASYCGGFMTRMRREARSVIGELCGADDRYAVIFSGSGATAGLNRLVTLLGVSAAVRSGKRARVIIGPYEHHSNILPWRESGAEIVELPESTNGGPDVAALDHALSDVADIGCVVCTFSAASNVTGIIADVRSLTRKVGLRRGRSLPADQHGAGAGRGDRRGRCFTTQVHWRARCFRRAHRTPRCGRCREAELAGRRNGQVRFRHPA